MTTIGASERRAHAESAFCEVQSIAHLATDAIEFHPANVRLVYAALVDQVLHQTSHGIICQGRNHGSFEPEAAFQSARDVILAATFPDAKLASSMNSIVSGIEPQHHLTERHTVPAAILLRFNVHR